MNTERPPHQHIPKPERLISIIPRQYTRYMYRIFCSGQWTSRQVHTQFWKVERLFLYVIFRYAHTDVTIGTPRVIPSRTRSTDYTMPMVCNSSIHFLILYIELYARNLQIIAKNIELVIYSEAFSKVQTTTFNKLDPEAQSLNLR